jgi:hypothetical protein
MGKRNVKAWAEKNKIKAVFYETSFLQNSRDGRIDLFQFFQIKRGFLIHIVKPVVKK